MSSTRPMRWIEQAEAREVMTDALFRQAPRASARKLAVKAIVEALANPLSCIVPEGPMPQMRPALVDRHDRRQHMYRRDDRYR